MGKVFSCFGGSKEGGGGGDAATADDANLVPDVKNDEIFSKEQLAEFRQAFDMFDTDKSGKISSKEIGELLRKVGKNPTEEEVTALVAACDRDKDGQLDFDEFIDLVSSQLTGPHAEEETLAAFKVFDKDGNGKITKEELRSALKTLNQKATDSEVEDMLTKADADGDGCVDYTEFAAMLKAD